ncbi:hypothetical protein [Microbacterium sp.]|uniref:hypothetical protein n=1 Tax=Microbacterium sp. TaxID=51671 RepID=UPI0035B44D70
MPSMPWPPAPFDTALAQFEEWDGLYTGVTRVAGVSPAATHVHNGVPHQGGLVGAYNRTMFGRPVVPGENRTSVHIPIAGDLAQLSSELLFAEAPKILLPDWEKGNKAAQERLELIVASDEGHAELLRSGEYAAAHGGTYLAVAWDAEVRDHVWFRSYRADCAIPEFRYGMLFAVTVWTEYAVKGKVYRLLERHRPGYIVYSLWRGSEHEKGEQVPVDEIPDTAHYAKITPKVDADRLPEAATLDIITPTGVPWLTCEYYPNMLPNPTWDREGALANLGRSDYFGIEDLFGTADFLWSSLIRDFVNGQGRLIVPESYLDTAGRGQGASFDPFRQVFATHGGLDRGKDGNAIEQVQFALRVEEHVKGIEAVKRQIAQSAGYSVAHFGIHDQITRTATEVTDNKAGSERTRDKKALYVRPALSRLARTALAIDGLLFRGKGGATIDGLPDVVFADVSQVDPERNARTIQMLDAAKAISTLVKVRAAHPEWDETAVAEEVARIQAEQGMTAPDPATFTGGDDE